MDQPTALRSYSSEERFSSALDRAQASMDKTKHNDCSLSWICIATILSSSLSIIVFLTSLTASKSQRDSAGGKHPSGALRRPSTYVNLEKALIEPDHIFPPISNFPQVVYQISTSDPLRQMAENTTRSWRAKVGIVYPDARRIFITNETSTVLQFRHVDFGMENCSFRFSIPSLTEAFDPSPNFQSQTIIDVWDLDTSQEISRYNGDTWKYAPRRGERVGSITLEYPRPDLTPFLCRSNQFSTFELACSPTSPQCYVDFWQDQRAEPKAGVYLLQRQTAVSTSI